MTKNKTVVVVMPTILWRKYLGGNMEEREMGWKNRCNTEKQILAATLPCKDTRGRRWDENDWDGFIPTVGISRFHSPATSQSQGTNSHLSDEERDIVTALRLRQ